MPFTGRYGILLVGVVDKRQAVCSPFKSGGASFCLPIVQKGGTNSDRCRWQKQGAVSGAALRFLQAGTAPRRKKRLSARGTTMVTYSDLIQTGILVVGIIGLFIQILKK